MNFVQLFLHFANVLHFLLHYCVWCLQHWWCHLQQNEHGNSVGHYLFSFLCIVAMDIDCRIMLTSDLARQRWTPRVWQTGLLSIGGMSTCQSTKLTVSATVDITHHFITLVACLCIWRIWHNAVVCVHLWQPILIKEHKIPGARRSIHSLTPILILKHPFSAFSIYCDP